MALDALTAKGKVLVRLDGRQVLLIAGDGQVYACTNRCPHEGYPLSEGTVTQGCVLTCNWHNWKFDLATGETLGGGDRLRRFPVKVADGEIWVDLAPEDPVERRGRIFQALEAALDDEDLDRLVREAARLALLGDEPAAAVTAAIAWSAERQEFGTTHAVAAAPDWLALHDDPATGPDEKLAAIGEILGHVAEDARRGPRFPYPPGVAPWDEAAFRAAVEAEDEAAAQARVRGALAEGLTPSGLLPAFATAALDHYADFGHSLIYGVKTATLAGRLGPASHAPLLALLTRSLVYATREDLIPEFRVYGAALAAWGRAGDAPPLDAAALRGLAPKSAMGVVSAWSARHAPEAIFETLVETAAWALLHVDERELVRTDGAIADNVGWLAFSHPLTFAEAGMTAVALRPSLWPALLLQMACFLGRNAAYLEADQDVAAFAVTDPAAFEAEAIHRLFDHGVDRFIISAHHPKTLRSGLALARALPDQAPLIRAALNRFLTARSKNRHILRTARQMRAFVAEE